MAEATKKGSQGTGSTGGRGKGTASGATDPNPQTANLGGASSSIPTGGTGSATTSGTTGSGITGSSTRTSGTHDMSADASQGSGLMDQMRSSASDTFKTVKSNTTAKLEEQKSTLSTGLMTVADNIRQLGSNLSGAQANDPLTRFAADYSETAAQKLRSAADYFNTHDVETMYRDVEGIARRNPAVFVGGAFAIGFLAARFLKSSSPRGNRGYGSSGNAMMSGGSGDSTRMPRLNTGGGTSNATAL
jgi:hypothetical protein